MSRNLTHFLEILFVIAPAFGQSTGYWHTSGNQILDAANQTVRIAGINWYGFETTDQVVHGLWAQDYRAILNAIKSNGYNVVRLPFSNQMVETPAVPSNISYNNSTGAINSDLRGLNALQIMDKIVAYAGQIGLRIILDNHRSEAGNSAEDNGLWYTGTYPEWAWINDWKALAQRYLDNPTVVGVDLRNEPHNANSGGACWGCGTANDWRLAAQRGGNAVLSVNPALLIVVEGTDCYNGDCDWWGGNLQGAQSAPVVLNVSNRLVYSPHDYGPNLYRQNWFNGSTTYSSLVSVWTRFWAYLSINGVAPVWVGEFGTTNNNIDIQDTTAGSQGQWFQSMITFLKNNPAMGWTYWALNGEDSYALLNNNYDATPANSLKQQLLASIQSSTGGGPTCSTAPPAPASLTANAVSSSQVNLAWSAVNPPTGCAITYSLYSSTTAGFTPSSANRIASGLTATSFSNTGLAASTTYYYLVTAIDSAGESARSNQASATTQTSGPQLPGAPSNLSATAISTTQINLSWTASATTGVTYNVYASAVAGFTPSTSNRVATGVSATSYSHAGLAPATTYYYRVTAANSAGESATSNQASATTQTSGGGGSSCRVTYAVNTQWNVGFNTSISIQNTGTSPINAWTLTWTWSGTQQIYQAWNANYTQNGPNVTLTNASWNGTIAPGASAGGIGFNASYTGVNSNPTAFFLNGVRCQ